MIGTDADQAVPTEGAIRTERDTLGPVAVPLRALWGAQTQRAVENFPISGIRTSAFPVLIRTMAMTKRAAALANYRIGHLPDHKYRAIALACDEVMENRHDAAFPVDMIQGGAGTSFNMNANEVIAALANAVLGDEAGGEGRIHANDDVNMSQSTNDVYPTAARLAVVQSHQDLDRCLRALVKSLRAKGRQFADVMKLGRTQLQDAVPITLGREFEAFAVTLSEDILRGREIVGLLREVHLGGTAVGTGLNASSDYRMLAIEELSRLSGLKLKPADDMVEATWDMGAFVLYSGCLKRTATKLSKIANDLRLLSSGPRGGFGEIHLPDRQPGSSIMPGKVNPVIPEVVNQACFQVIGNDVAITFAAEAGQLQLNAMEPLIVFNVLMSIRILTNAVTALTERCITGIRADKGKCRSHLEAGTGLVTALVPIIGYERAASLAKAVLATGASLPQMMERQGIVLVGSELDLLDAKRMVPLAGKIRRMK